MQINSSSKDKKYKMDCDENSIAATIAMIESLVSHFREQVENIAPGDLTEAGKKAHYYLEGRITDFEDLISETERDLEELTPSPEDYKFIEESKE